MNNSVLASEIGKLAELIQDKGAVILISISDLLISRVITTLGCSSKPVINIDMTVSSVSISASEIC